MVIDLESNLYPKILKKIEDAPKRLYVEGNVENLNTHCFAVVGSRKGTEYGKKWCKIFVEELIQYDLTIVSGMAIGTDTIAHQQVLKLGGRTIAVLPCGLENIYPKENMRLYQQILQNGGTVITEYRPEEKADSHKFLQRNRIVTGLSIAALVVEAAYRSGTSVTAKLAKAQNKEVFCIPGNLDQPKSRGTNHLIKEFAKIAISPKDIVSQYKFLHKTKKIQNKEKQADELKEMAKEDRDIYQWITQKPIDINDIVRLSNRNLKEVIPKLTMLELEGKIKKVAGNQYIRGDGYS